MEFGGLLGEDGICSLVRPRWEEVDRDIPVKKVIIVGVIDIVVAM